LKASPSIGKLECWNIGKMGPWILQIGWMVKFQFDDTILNGQEPLNTHYSIIPIFHYSIIEKKPDN
jgi:hypothetical protein